MPALLALMLAIIRAARLVPAPYELGYGEGLVLWLAQHAMAPSEQYRSITAPPFVVGVYPPLHPLMVFALSQALGDVQLAGRVIGLVAFVGLLLVLGTTAYRMMPRACSRSGRCGAALAAAGLAASIGAIREFPPAVRVDGLGLLLTMSGMLLFLADDRGGWRRDGAVVCFVAAVFTKQTFVAAPLACLIVLLLTDRRAAGRFVALALVLAFVPTLALMLETDAQFLRHLLGYTTNEFSLMHLKAQMLPNIREMLPVVLAAAGGVGAVDLSRHFGSARGVTQTRRGSSTRRSILCLALYVVLAFLVSCTAGNVGSGAYYFMEWNAACCLLAGISFGLFACCFPMRRHRTAALIIGLSVMAVGATASLDAVNPALRLTEGARALEAAQRSESARALQFIRETSGPVLSYDLTLLVKAGRDVPFEPFIMYQLTRSGDWNPQPFIDELERCKYRALIAAGEIDSSPWLPESIKDVIDRRYPGRLLIGNYVVHLPISRGSVTKTSGAERRAGVTQPPRDGRGF
jgi:hypothetical protein